MSATTAIKIVSTTAFKTTLEAISFSFESTAGKTISAEFGPSLRTAKRIREGEAVDIAIIADDAMEPLIAEGLIDPGSRIDVARSDLAVAIVAGGARPDISSAESFKDALLNARSIALSNPAGGGRSGIYMQSVLERLKLGEALKPKIVYGGGGPAGLISLLLKRGDAELGIQQKAELMAVPGIDVIGPLPAGLQNTTVFSIGTTVNATNRGAGKLLFELLRTPAAAALLRANGLDPV